MNLPQTILQLTKKSFEEMLCVLNFTFHKMYFHNCLYANVSSRLQSGYFNYIKEVPFFNCFYLKLTRNYILIMSLMRPCIFSFLKCNQSHTIIFHFISSMYFLPSYVWPYWCCSFFKILSFLSFFFQSSHSMMI